MRVPMGGCTAEEGAGEVFEDMLNDLAKMRREKGGKHQCKRGLESGKRQKELWVL